MSVIFPGNYVADLNAYRDQGVLSTPGVEFYQFRGVAMVTDALTGGGSIEAMILSPDMRQDDKPRQDKPMVIPAGATVYRSAITAVNVSAAGTETVAVDGLTTASLEASLAAVGGEFPSAGATTEFDGFQTTSSEAAAAPISVAYSGSLNVVDPSDQACVIVEVCFYLDGEAPTTDDVHLPYKTEAGTGT